MDAIQRQRARSAGQLTSNQQQLAQETAGAIEVVLAQPEVIYVPVYDPVMVWGPPVFHPSVGFFFVKTFVVNHEGAVWEKDLGPRTTAIASAIRRYNPDPTWKPSPHGAAEVPRAPAPRP